MKGRKDNRRGYKTKLLEGKEKFDLGRRGHFQECCKPRNVKAVKEEKVEDGNTDLHVSCIDAIGVKKK